MERAIDRVATGVGGAIGAAAETGVLFVAFAVLWLAFGVLLIVNQGDLDAAWSWIRSLPLLAQLAVWVLFLPVVLGLWIWETTWPWVLRLVLVIGIAGWNLLIFLPRWLTARP